jgi:hypothetical protein
MKSDGREGVTLSWLQFGIGVMGLFVTMFSGWHSIVTQLEINTAVQQQDLSEVKTAVKEQ